MDQDCVLCRGKAELRCERCQELYCSHSCQKEDWPYHKLTCFPMPRLVKTDVREHNIKIETTNQQNSRNSTSTMRPPITVGTEENVVIDLSNDEVKNSQPEAQSTEPIQEAAAAGVVPTEGVRIKREPRNVKKRGNVYYKCVYCGRASVSGSKDGTINHMKKCNQKPSRANVKVDIINGRVNKKTFVTLPKMLRGRRM